MPKVKDAPIRLDVLAQASSLLQMAPNGKKHIVKDAGIIKNTITEMYFHKYFVSLATLIICSGCGLCHTSDSDKNEGSTEDINMSEDQQGTFVVCPMCGGDKFIQDIYSGNVIDCPACEGYGVVTEDMAQELMEAQRIGMELAGGNPDDVGTDYSGYDIQSEIEQCQREIENLENALANLEEGSTLYMYYSNELISLRYKLRQLQMQF